MQRTAESAAAAAASGDWSQMQPSAADKSRHQRTDSGEYLSEPPGMQLPLAGLSSRAGTGWMSDDSAASHGSSHAQQQHAQSISSRSDVGRRQSAAASLGVQVEAALRPSSVRSHPGENAMSLRALLSWKPGCCTVERCLCSVQSLLSSGVNVIMPKQPTERRLVCRTRCRSSAGSSRQKSGACACEARAPALHATCGQAARAGEHLLAAHAARIAAVAAVAAVSQGSDL